MSNDLHDKYPYAGPALFTTVAAACLAFFIWLL